ncbi:MAG: hypothetical protein DRN20_04325 [Thermoplasmata archaeon]|nr:MAG: hypothetical protein DRN20_04325 [Thermoplasmata archaeon]
MDEISLNDLLKIKREETRKNALTKVPPGFYAHACELLMSIRKRIENEKSSSPKISMLVHEEKRVRNAFRKICDLRLRKILILAHERVVGGPGKHENLLDEEEKIVEAIANRIAKIRDRLLEGGHDIDKELVFAGAEDDEKEAVFAEGVGKRPPYPYEVVMALEDIPPFEGPERTYKVCKGDILSLPADIANLLQEKGAIRILFR